MIKVNNLHKHYNKGRKNEQHILKNVNLEFGRTGLVCILGESGSGKTTLLNIIGGIDEFSQGQIEIDGTVVNKYDKKVIEPIRNDRFDYIFQNYYLLQDYSVAYNVKLALNRFDLSEEEKDSRVEYVLDMLGIGKYKKKLVSKLSGGQQQRVSIARALVKSPDIILADEPTGNLDEENTLRTMSILKSISKECLVLLVTHEKRIARFFADRIIEIKDGEVVRDEINKNASSYEKMDDSNIYLKEMDCSTLESDFADFKIYTSKNNSDMSVEDNQADEFSHKEGKIELGFAWRDGKLYIRNNMKCDVIMEGIESGVRMLDEERPKIDMEEIENFAYDLKKPKSKGKASLSAREIWKLAIENIRLMGKKQAFIIGILVLTAVLLSITLAEFINTVSIDEESVVSTDSHYLELDFVKVSSLRAPEQQIKILEYAWEYIDDNEYGEVFLLPESSLYLMGDGYAQMVNLLQRMTGFSYAGLNYVRQDDLVHGRMPEGRNEVVIDMRVINKLMESDGVVSGFYDTAESYIGAKLTVATTSEVMEIVGICDTNEANIYCSQNLLLGFDVKGYRIASDAEFRQLLKSGTDSKVIMAAKEKYSTVSLAPDEVLLSADYCLAYGIKEGDYMHIGDDDKHAYKVVGIFPEGMGFNYILSEEGCKNVRDIMIYETKSCMIYIEDAGRVKEAVDYFDKCSDGYGAAFRLEQRVPYEEEIKAYKEAHSVNVDSKYLISIAGVVVSLIMIYFTIKSNAVSRSEELTVYRLIGISRGSILKAYVLEMLLMTCYSSLPAVLITSGVIKFISSIPSLQMGLLLPWWSVMLLMVGICIVHTVISIMPVYGILSKPPAVLALKE